MAGPAALVNPPPVSHAPPHVIIIGGGVTGLSAAFYLDKLARAANLPMHYTLIERDLRLGGKILTDRIEHPAHFIIEGGPDSFVAQKPWGVDLIRELGLEDQLMGANEADRKTFILFNGKPYPMPDGLQLIVPTKFWPFVRSPLLSPLGKLRMLLDVLIPPKRDGADETLADFVRRRFGTEALDKFGEPLMSGIHSSEAERQSLLATFPRFRALEEKHGSLIRGMRAHRRSNSATKDRQDQQLAGPAALSAQIATSPFLTLRAGVGTLIDALAARLDGHLLTGREVHAIEHTPEADQRYRVELDHGEVLAADAVILATPAFVAADLVRPFQPELAAELERMRYVSTATVTLAYRRRDIGEPLKGFGLIIPPSEQRRINACTMTSIKFAHRAPDEYTLVRVFVGGSRTPDSFSLDDVALLALVRQELRAIVGIAAEPVWSRIYRWPQANPQYDVGHLDRLKTITSLCPQGLYLSGSAYGGVGIPDCIRQGKEAATQALEQIAHVLSS